MIKMVRYIFNCGSYGFEISKEEKKWLANEVLNLD
jgi:hypothetical protein